MFSDAMVVMTVEKARGQLANEAADLIWDHIYEGKKLSSDDLNFVLAALQWFALWPTTNANYAKTELINLLQQRGW